MTADEWANYITSDLNDSQAECRDRLPVDLLTHIEDQKDDPLACPDCNRHMVKIGLDTYRCTSCKETWNSERG